MARLCNEFSLSNLDSALVYGDKALALSRKINYPTGQIRAIAFQSGVANNLGNLPKALTLAYEALRIAEANQLAAEKRWPFIYISTVYRALQDYPKALHFRKMAMKIAEGLDNASYEYQNVGLLYVKLHQLDSASYYLQKAYRIEQATNDLRPIVLQGLGDIEAQKGHIGAALGYYRKGLQLSGDLESHRYYSIISIQSAKLFHRLHQVDSSIYYARLGLTNAERVAYKQSILDASLLLSELYEPMNTKEAFRYFKLAAKTKESVFGAGNVQAIQQMIAQEEGRQREMEAAKVKYADQLKQYALLTGLGVFLLIAFILYRTNQQQKKANLLLFRQKEAISVERHKAEQALTELKITQTQLIQAEKMASLGELTAGIAHEIQNPLNFVNNFSEVSVELIEELKQEAQAGHTTDVMALADDLTQNLQKVTLHGGRASAIVKGMLEHSRTSTSERQPTDLNALCEEYLRLAYHGQRAKDKSFNAELKTDFDPTLLKIEVVPQEIGRVFLNLFNNAFYAIQQKQKAAQANYQPTVRVSTKQVIGKLEIRVHDNGMGIPDAVKAKIFQPFFSTKPTGEGTGLGLSLSYDIITKGHGGTLTMESTLNVCTEFIITLPTP
ncbi:hypothetical protein GCM10027190_63700 [Spirosoma areae]